MKYKHIAFSVQASQLNGLSDEQVKDSVVRALRLGARTPAEYSLAVGAAIDLQVNEYDDKNGGPVFYIP